MRALAHLSVVFTLVIRGQCRVLPGGAPAPAANKFALETRVRNWHWNQYSKHIGTVDVSRPLLNPCKGEMPDRASIASYHKAGTKASAQLTEILNTSHDYYYHGYAKPYTSPVVVVTRNPFDLVLSGYEYHKACTEAYYSQAFASREELLDREWRFSASSKGHGLRKVALMSEILFPHIAPVKLDNVESYCQWLQRLSLKDGLTIEMYRSSWYPMEDMLRGWRCDQGESVHRVCLNDVVKNTESTIEDILNFFAEEWGGRYVTENLTAVIDAYKEMSERKHAQKHMQSYDTQALGYDKRNAHAIMRALDKKYFNNIFADMEELEQCESSVILDSTEYRHAATEMGLNEDEADDANHDVTPVERRSRRGVTDSVSQDGLQVDESVHDVLENMSLYELIRKLYECSKSVTQSSIFDSTIPFEEFQTRAMAVPISSLIGKMSRICKEN